MILVAAILGLVVVIGLAYGIVRSLRAQSLANLLVQTPPVTGRVIGSGIVESPFYISSGGMDTPGADPTPVDRRHFRKRVETIEYTARDGRTRRAQPALVESSLPDRTGMEVRVHVHPEEPDVFIAPVGDRPAMFPIHLRIWGPVLFCVVLVSIFVCVFGLLVGFDGPQPPRP